MSDPKLSIIIPVYQAEKYLHRCMESVLAQTFRGWECILVDDGSTDGSGALCDTYARRDVRVRVLHSANGGASAARNSALPLARGEWVEFVDSDDALRPDYCAALLEASQGAELVIAGYTIVTETDNAAFSPGRTGCIETAAELALAFDGLYFGMLLNSPCNKLYRRKLLTARFPEDIPMGEDLLLNMDYLAGVERTALIQNTGYLYHQDNSGSATNNFRWNTPERMLEYCHAVLPVLARAEDRAAAERTYKRIVYHSLCNNLNVAARSDGPLTPRIGAYLALPEVREAVRGADTGDFPRSKRLMRQMLQLGLRWPVAAGLRIFGR